MKKSAPKFDHPERGMSPKFLERLERQIAEIQDLHCYVIVSVLYSMKLYYLVDSDGYAMKRPFEATRFKSEDIVRSVVKTLDSKTLSKDGCTWIKATKKNTPKLDRLQIWKVKQSPSKKTWKFVEIVNKAL